MTKSQVKDLDKAGHQRAKLREILLINANISEYDYDDVMDNIKMNGYELLQSYGRRYESIMTKILNIEKTRYLHINTATFSAEIYEIIELSDGFVKWLSETSSWNSGPLVLIWASILCIIEIICVLIASIHMKKVKLNLIKSAREAQNLKNLNDYYYQQQYVDSHLYHLVKNDYVGMCELLSNIQNVANVDQEMISTMIGQCEKGVEKCLYRQTIQDLVSGKYILKPSTMTIGQLKRILSRRYIQVSCYIGDSAIISIDLNVIYLILENAFANVRQHGIANSVKLEINKCTDTGIKLVIMNKYEVKTRNDNSNFGIGLQTIEICAKNVNINTKLSLNYPDAVFTCHIPDCLVTSKDAIIDIKHLVYSKKIDYGKCKLVMVIDDSQLMRLAWDIHLNKYVSSEKIMTLGATSEEIHGFADNVLENKPDIVILDYYLENSINGSDILRTLREKEFIGYCVVCSANVTPNNTQMYLDMGFDFAMEKGIGVQLDDMWYTWYLGL